MTAVRTPRQAAIDLLVLAVLFLLALIGFHTVYGGVLYLVTGVMALLIGGGIAALAARFRWGALRITPLVVLAYFLLGSAFAAPTHALWSVLPSGASLLELLVAPVTTWKSTLTVAPPVGSAEGVLAVVWISTLLLSLLAVTIVLRTRWYVAAWLCPMLLLLITIAFGTNQAVMPLARGVLFALVSVAWLTWRFESARIALAASTIISDTVRPGSWKNPVLRRRVIGGSVIMTIAAVTALLAAPLLDPPTGAQRYAVRDHIAPPFDAHQFVSPLTDFRGYIKLRGDTELFTLSDVTGGQKIRLATMDQYDLQVYNVAGSRSREEASGAFLKTAGGVDLHEAGPGQRTTRVTIKGYNDVWVPTLGARTDRIDVDEMPTDRAASMVEHLYLNQQTQTAIDTAQFAPGDTYELRYTPYQDPTDAQVRTASFDQRVAEELPALDTLPSEMSTKAEEWLGASENDMEQVQNFLRSLKKDASFSHGVKDEAASLPGHGIARLNAMFEENSFDQDKPDDYPKGMIGDQEQYAVLAAAMLRSIGIPARVVMGFEVPEGAKGETTITGEDVTAWIEVAFTDIGWVRFDAHPDEDDVPVQQEPIEVDKPRPQVAQPPPPPAEPPSPPPGAMSDETDKDDDPTEETTLATWIILLAVSPLVLLLLFIAAVLGAKALRRRRRRRRLSVHAQVQGGWEEILDLLTDMGRSASPVSTRSEIVAALQAQIPSAGLGSLAAHADRAVFGPDDLSAAASEDYWQRVRQARREMARSQPWHRRIRAALSLRSFRRAAAERRRQRRVVAEQSAARRRAQRRRQQLRGRSSSRRRNRSILRRGRGRRA